MTAAELAELKVRSEDRLRHAGIKVNENLPALERVAPRPAQELAARALVMNALIEAGEGAPPPLVRKWIESNRLDASLTQDERVTLAAKALPPLDRDSLIWRAESVWTLSWVLSRVAKLDWEAFAPTGRKALWADVKKNESALPYLQGLAMRPVREIAQEADFAFRLHWAAVDASYLGEAFPAERFHPDLIVERRHALQWAISAGTSWAETDLSV